MSISDANDKSMIKYNLHKRQITSKQHSNKRTTDSSDMNDHHVSFKVAKRNPPSPTTQKINELKELMEAPISPSYYSESHNSPPSPTRKKMEEFHKLITAPPTAEELMQREHRSSTDTSTMTNKGTSSTSSQTLVSDPAPFSKEVIRSGPRKSMPVGYRSNKNRIALSAETFIKKRKTDKHDEAIRLAREKLENKKAKDKAIREEWREIAAIDPEKAGKRKQLVPKGLSKELYIPARAHQLQFRGKAKTFEERKRLAQLEQDKVAAYTRKRGEKRRAKAKQPR